MRIMKCTKKKCGNEQIITAVGGTYKYDEKLKATVKLNKTTGTWELDLPPICDKCGGKLSNAEGFSGTNVIANVGKHDPTSPLYWKKGKSATEIADIIADANIDPY